MTHFSHTHTHKPAPVFGKFQVSKPGPPCSEAWVTGLNRSWSQLRGAFPPKCLPFVPPALVVLAQGRACVNYFCVPSVSLISFSVIEHFPNQSFHRPPLLQRLLWFLLRDTPPWWVPRSTEDNAGHLRTCARCHAGFPAATNKWWGRIAAAGGHRARGQSQSLTTSGPLASH